MLFVTWFLFCNAYYIQSQNLRNPRCMWMGVKYYHLVLIHWTFHVLFTCHGLVYANYLRCHLFMRLKSTIGWYIFSAHLFYIHSFIWNPTFLITQLHNHLHVTFVLQIFESHFWLYFTLRLPILLVKSIEIIKLNRESCIFGFIWIVLIKNVLKSMIWVYLWLKDVI